MTAHMTADLTPAWRALLDRVVAEYRATLGSDLVALACFGSVARGEARPDSDLDLYAVTRARVSVFFDARLDRLRRLRESAEYQRLAAEGYRPEPMPIFHTVEDLRSHPWIVLDIAHHGVVLFDPDGVLAMELEAVRQRLRQLGSRRIERPDGTWYWDLKPDWRPGETIEL